MAAYRWSESDGRFRDAAGRFVSEAAVRRVVDDIANHASERAAAASTRLLAGELSLASWQTEMAQVVKLSHVSTSMLAHGGAEGMTPARWGAAGNRIRGEYQYLREFAAAIESGDQPLTSGLTARAAQYGQAARVTYERERARGQQERGFLYERNVMAPAEHCADCIAQTARGWVPIGALSPIGQRACRSNDRCRLEFSRSREMAA
jgi:hypothetical protein